MKPLEVDAAAASGQVKEHEAEPDAPLVPAREADPLGWFGRYLSLFVLLAMVLGSVLGYFVPEIPISLNYASVAGINIVIAVLIWVMVFPMFLHVDWFALTQVGTNPRPLMITTFVNYAIQPFVMFGLALLFFREVFGGLLSPELQDQYIAGSVILGGAPCTAMVFVWSSLVRGHAGYTLTQVAVNDLIMLGLYVPTTGLLINAQGIPMPWDTIVVSIVLFIVVPLVAALGTRRFVSTATVSQIEATLKPWTAVALLLTLVVIFAFQGQQIVTRIIDILLIAVPLTIQTYAIFGVAYALMYWQKVEFRFAAPGALIASSNFFELAVAVAAAIYGPGSGAVLATVVGVLTEVPIMLSLCWFSNSTKALFPAAPHLAEEPAGPAV
jgi:arsenite transporter